MSLKSITQMRETQSHSQMWESFKGKTRWLTKAKKRRQVKAIAPGPRVPVRTWPDSSRVPLGAPDIPWSQGMGAIHGWWNGTWGLWLSHAGQPDGSNKGAFVSASQWPPGSKTSSHPEALHHQDQSHLYWSQKAKWDFWFFVRRWKDLTLAIIIVVPARNIITWQPLPLKWKPWRSTAGNKLASPNNGFFSLHTKANIN